MSVPVPKSAVAADCTTPEAPRTPSHGLGQHSGISPSAPRPGRGGDLLHPGLNNALRRRMRQHDLNTVLNARRRDYLDASDTYGFYPVTVDREGMPHGGTTTTTYRFRDMAMDAAYELLMQGKPVQGVERCRTAFESDQQGYGRRADPLTVRGVLA